MKTLKAANLAKSYDGRQIVKDVSMEVKSGQIVGLLGPNGAGKTTCFYMIVNLVQADHGTVSIDGHLYTSYAADEEEHVELRVYHTHKKKKNKTKRQPNQNRRAD